MPKAGKYAPYLTWDNSKQEFRFTLVNGKRVGLGKNSRIAIAKANAYNAKMRQEYSIEDLIGDKNKIIPFDEIQDKILAREKLSDEVTKELKRDMARAKEFFTMTCPVITIGTCQDYLKKYHSNVSGEWFNKKIGFLNKLFKYVVAEGLIKKSDNPAAGLLRDKPNEKRRQRLSIEGFNAIRNHQDSPLWFQTAMDLALQLGHGRTEILTIKRRIRKATYKENGCVWFKDPVNGVYGTLYINRKKTEKHESAHVGIPIGPEVKDIIDRSLDKLTCPYVVHARPKRTPKKMAGFKDHMFQVTPDNLDKQFRNIARNLPMYSHLEDDEVPTFHEIRALHAFLLKKMGFSSKERMAQKDQRSNDLYTEGHEEFVHVEHVAIDLQTAVNFTS